MGPHSADRQAAEQSHESTSARREFMRKSSAKRVRRVPATLTLTLECLDGLALPSVVLSHGILNVSGTNGADFIDVSVDPLTSSLVLDLNGATRTFDLGLVSGIRINPRGGDDTIQI